MDTKNLVTAVFAVLAVIFASIAVYEYPPSASSNTTVVSTTTIVASSGNETTTTSCTATGGIGCPHFMNVTWAVSVEYGGPWGATYQGWVGDQASGRLVASGEFYGNSTGSEAVNVSGTTEYGITFCVEAQKLDPSTSTLVVTIINGGSSNQTSLAYGTAKACVANVIA